MAFQTRRFSNPFGFSITPWVRRLLVANVAVAILGWILAWIGFPGLLTRWFALIPAEILTRPWTPLTYLFLHGGFWHLLVNMIGLFFFGPPLEERWGSPAFLRFYLIAGLGGALLSLAIPNAVIIGASGAIYGILLAYAMAWPDNLIYLYGVIPVKAKWLVTAVIAITAFSAIASRGSGVAHLAHLGGLATGFLYLKSPWAPNPFGGTAGATRQSRGVLERLRELRRGAPATTPRGSLPANAADARRRRRAQPEAAREQQLVTEIDHILDKISANGIASLTDEERQRLDEVSRRYRTN